MIINIGLGVFVGLWLFSLSWIFIYYLSAIGKKPEIPRERPKPKSRFKERLNEAMFRNDGTYSPIEDKTGSPPKESGGE